MSSPHPRRPDPVSSTHGAVESTSTPSRDEAGDPTARPRGDGWATLGTVGSISPVVPAGGVFEGEVSIAGDTRIEGTVVGTLRGPGRLRLGPAARIEGEIECEEVECQGQIVGPVRVRHALRLGSGARLVGDLSAPVLEMADGAILDGNAQVGPRR